MSDRGRAGIPRRPIARISEAVALPPEPIAQDVPLARFSSLGAPTCDMEQKLAEIEGDLLERLSGSDPVEERHR